MDEGTKSEDQELILWATEIKVRAERKAGALLLDMAKTGESSTRQTNYLHDEANPSAVVDMKPKTLAGLGVNANQSSHWQQLAAMPEEHFETAVATAKESPRLLPSAT